MTSSEDFTSFDDGSLEAAPNYPSVFGITLTPVIGGALIAVLGLAGTLYLLLTLVMPTWQKYQEMEASRNQKQALIAQKQAIQGQIEKIRTELAQAKQQKSEVLVLFANEKTLDTLLLDLNQVVESGNARLQRNDFRGKLKRFVPVNQSAELIADGSLGSEVNGKLKRRTINVEVEGTFEQTQSIMRNIERLQPLLIFKDYQSTLGQAAPDSRGKTVNGPPTITTSFQLQALMPVNSEEATSASFITQPQK